MAYEFTILNGRIANPMAVAEELGQLAIDCDMPAVPINVLISGTLRQCTDLFGRGMPSNIMRPFPLKEGELPAMICELKEGSIQQEHVQGIILLREHGAWPFLWNLTHNGAIVQYRPLQIEMASSCPIISKACGNKVREAFQSAPTPISGNFTESPVRLECYRRRFDIAAAFCALEILNRYSENFEAEDEWLVWQKQDLRRWGLGIYLDRHFRLWGYQAVSGCNLHLQDDA